MWIKDTVGIATFLPTALVLGNCGLLKSNRNIKPTIVMDILNREKVETALRELCDCPELNKIILRSAGREDVQFGGVIEILQEAHLEYCDEYGDVVVPKGQFEASMCQYIEALLGEGDHTEFE